MFSLWNLPSASTISTTAVTDSSSYVTIAAAAAATAVQPEVRKRSEELGGEV